MLGQSALLRIRVVGMSVSVNSSSRSTTYAILPGRKSSFLSSWPERNTTRKMFLPKRRENKRWLRQMGQLQGEDPVRGRQQQKVKWTHPVESWIQSSLPDLRPSWNIKTFESASADTLITDVYLMLTIILCFLLDFLHHVFLFFLFTGDFSSHLKQAFVQSGIEQARSFFFLLTVRWARVLPVDSPSGAGQNPNLSPSEYAPCHHQETWTLESTGDVSLQLTCHWRHKDAHIYRAGVVA